jgi:PAS domain S-box-containing protein
MSGEGNKDTPPFASGAFTPEGPFAALLEAVPGIVWSSGSSGDLRFASPRCLAYIGAGLPELLGDGLVEYVHSEDRARFKAIPEAVAAGSRNGVEVRLRRHDGVYRWHRLFCVQDRDVQGQLQGVLSVAIDFEQQKELEQDSLVANARFASAQRDMEAALAKRNEAIEQLEAFAYSIAHDMRAPLRAMHQYAEIVARDFVGQVPEDALSYLKRIMAAADRLDSHVRDVLVYTRVSQGRMEMQSMNVERVLSEILLMYPQLNPPVVEITPRLPLHSVIGDHTALTQSISNLLSNAVKFVPSDRKPKVEIWTELTGETVRIHIRDNGIGIAAGDQHRIFKLFERVQPDSAYEGSGIGLTIVRRAVERMGGKLGVESEEGKSTTFWMELKKGDL